MVLNSGIQMYLNAAFTAHKKVTGYSKMLQQTSKPPTGEKLTDMQDLRAECIKRNLAILSGDLWLDVLSHYCKFMEYSDEAWLDWRLTVEDKYASCLNMIVVCQDVFYRLIMQQDQATFEVLEVGRIPEGEFLDFAAVRAVGTRISEQRKACSECVDRTFSAIWALRLQSSSDITCRKAHSSVCDIIALLRVNSLAAEMKHLVGQELKPSKRGRCVGAAQLGKLVFR